MFGHDFFITLRKMLLNILRYLWFCYLDEITLKNIKEISYGNNCSVVSMKLWSIMFGVVAA